jgi:hypothetical protein
MGDYGDYVTTRVTNRLLRVISFRGETLSDTEGSPCAACRLVPLPPTARAFTRAARLR